MSEVIASINEALDVLSNLSRKLQAIRRHEQSKIDPVACAACRHPHHDNKRCEELDRFSEQCGCTRSLVRRNTKRNVCECGMWKDVGKPACSRCARIERTRRRA